MKLFVIGSHLEPGVGGRDYESFCRELGQLLAAYSIDLLMCSPYQDAADSLLVEGIEKSNVQKLSLELYYPKSDEIEAMWNSKIKELRKSINVTRFPQESPLLNEPASTMYAWLFCQMQAIINSNYVLVIGGKLSGSSNLLVRVADAQGKKIIPIAEFGGVGRLFYDKKKYQLIDDWGVTYTDRLFENITPDALIDPLVNVQKFEAVDSGSILNNDNLTFFISYSRERPSKADYIETILRRRNYNVIRDESDISASQDIPNAIKENILKSDVFIALWCKEYACSPWCFDEFNIALDSHNGLGKSLWIFRTDKTRMVPPKARKLLWYDVESREEIEGKILGLLARLSKKY